MGSGRSCRWRTCSSVSSCVRHRAAAPALDLVLHCARRRRLSRWGRCGRSGARGPSPARVATGGACSSRSRPGRSSPVRSCPGGTQSRHVMPPTPTTQRRAEPTAPRLGERRACRSDQAARGGHGHGGTGVDRRTARPARRSRRPSSTSSPPRSASFLVRPGHAHRRPPRPEPRRRRAHPRASTGSSTRPRDAIVFDTGHQAYVHKLLTGRQDFAAPAQQPAASPATPAGPSPSTTSSRTPTPRPRCPGPTASPRPSR